MDRSQAETQIWLFGDNPATDFLADAIQYDQAVAAVAEVYQTYIDNEDASFDTIARLDEQALSLASPLVRRITPGFSRALRIRRGTQMHRDALVVIAAIWAYKEQHKEWRETVDDALDGFPAQPWSRAYYGRDFVYRIEFGEPMLYAVGPNGVDDGGRGWFFLGRGGESDDVLLSVSSIRKVRVRNRDDNPNLDWYIELAEDELRDHPESSFHKTTLALLLHRHERYGTRAQQGLDTLDGQHTGAGQAAEAHPVDLAVRSMALHRVGRRAEANDALARLRAVMREERWRGDQEAHDLRREAEELILGEAGTHSSTDQTGS